jgi:SAM-dependent methyltransferase
MNNIARPQWSFVDYWEANARWYDLWLQHNHYHAPIKSVLAARVRPGWRILDIGGGSGVLSLFLRRIGCRTVLLEPAGAIRTLFSRDAARAGLDGFEVEPRRWEDIPLDGAVGFLLILACNSLHVSSVGFEAALKKVFEAGARHVCIVAEYPHAALLGERRWRGYARLYSERRDVASSRAYHCPEEALEQAAFCAGKTISADERQNVLDGLVFENGHYWLKDTVAYGLEWWTRSAPDK